MTAPLPTEALGLMSALLHYPDDELLADLPRMQAAAARLAPGDLRQAIEGFLGHLADRPLLALQTAYTTAFDLNPATTLNLTWHRYGDNENRAAALARLQRRYDAAGWERTTGDLPDYLPLMLEFLALCPAEDATGEIQACLGSMASLIEPLTRTAPAYAELLRPLARATA
jgi:nitrate reductase molybdenum cofactor assembly chaperone NarJ/NarW